MNRRHFLAAAAGVGAGSAAPTPTITDMQAQNRFSPWKRIGQDTRTIEEFQLTRQSTENPDNTDPVDLTDATRVTITLEHSEIGFTLASDEPCEIVTPGEGIVSYTFSQAMLRTYWGNYYIQFEIHYSDGTSETIPPDIEERFITITRNSGAEFPITLTQPLHGTEAYFEDLEADRLTVHDALRGLHTDATASERITRLDGQGITVGPTGSLDIVWPGVDTYPEGGPHSHLNDTLGADQLYPRDLRVAGQPHHDVTHPDYDASGGGATDDTQAIQDAVTAAGGGEVFFPPGEYRVTSPIIGETDELTIRGSGEATTILVDGPDFWLRLEGTSTDPVEDVTVRDLHVDETSGNGIIRFRDASRPWLINVSKTGLETGGGLAHFNACTQGVVANCSVQDISSTSGLAFLGGSEDFLFANLFADGCGEVIDGNPMRGCLGVNIRGDNLADEIIDLGGSSHNAFFGLRGENVNRGVILKTEAADYGGSNHNLIDGLFLRGVQTVVIEGAGKGQDAPQTLNNNTFRNIHAVGDGSGADGVSWSHSADLDVAENTTIESFFFDCDGDGIDIMSQQGLTIRDGHILGPDRGIRLPNHYDVHGFSRDVLIEDVKIEATDRFGIWGQYLAEWDIKDCRLLDIGDTAAADGHPAIEIENSTKGRVSGGVVDRVTGRGIILRLNDTYARRSQVNTTVRDIDVTNTNLVSTEPAAVDVLNAGAATVNGVRLEGITITDDQPLAEVTTGGFRWSQGFNWFKFLNCECRRTANSPDNATTIPGTDNVASGNLIQ